MDNKWTVIFLIYADFYEVDVIRGEEQVLRELHFVYADILNTEIADDVDVFTVLSSIRYLGNEVMHKTFIHKLIKDAPNSLELIGTNDNIDPLQKKCCLTSILNFIKAQTNGSRIFLNTWDHGSVFGIYRDEGKAKGYVEKVFEISFDDIFKGFLLGPNNLKPTPATYKSKNNIFAVRENDLEKFEDILKRQEYYNLAIDRKKRNARFQLRNDITLLAKVPSQFQNIEWSELIGSATPSPVDQTLTVNEDNKHTIADLIEQAKDRQIENNKIILRSNGDEAILESSKFNLTKLRTVLVDKLSGHAINLNNELEILTNQELAQSIAESFGKVDVLLMMNCNMMTVHSMAAFSERVDFFVAPESGIAEPGYNYCAILSQINNTLPTDNLAKICVETFNGPAVCRNPSCRQHRDDCKRNNSGIILFSDELNSTNIQLLIETINKFSISIVNLSKVSNGNFNNLRDCIGDTIKNDCLQQTEQNHYYYLYDLEDWALKFIKNSTMNAYNGLDKVLGGLAINFHADIQNLKTSIVRAELPPLKYSSFTIFFPIEQVSTKKGIGPYIVNVQDRIADPLSDWLDLLITFFP